MADKYIAVGTVGSFLPEQEVTGLEDKRYKELLDAGKVRVVKGEDDKKSETTRAKTTKK